MIVTRKELDDARNEWWWLMWCREWAAIGAFYAETERLERSLWGSP